MSDTLEPVSNEGTEDGVEGVDMLSHDFHGYSILISLSIYLLQGIFKR